MGTKIWLAALFGCVGVTAHAQIYKCPSVGGGLVLQQAPCEGGQKIDVKPSGGAVPPGSPAPIVKPTKEVAKATPPVTSDDKLDKTGAPVAAISALDAEATLCLNFIKPRLKDPRGAYYEDVSKGGVGGTVLSLTIHAKNSYGGVVPKAAKCEIKNGVVDPNWTRIHLDDLGWGRLDQW